MRYDGMLELATAWGRIQKATTKANTCIRPKWVNHDKAEEDWRKHPGQVEYWIGQENESYARVVRLTPLYSSKPVWMLDFAKPFTGDHICDLVKVLFESLMVSGSEPFTLSGNLKYMRLFLPPIIRPDWLQHSTRAFNEGYWTVIEALGSPGSSYSRKQPEPATVETYC